MIFGGRCTFGPAMIARSRVAKIGAADRNQPATWRYDQAMSEPLVPSTSPTAIPMHPSRRRWLGCAGLLAFMTALVGCAALSPQESAFGYSSIERWEADKRERLGECSHDPTI